MKKLVLLGIIIILTACGTEETVDYEIVEEDKSRENVLSVRVVTDSKDEEELKNIAEEVSEEIRDTGTFEGLNMYAAYIRIHEKSDNDTFGGMILDSKIAYREEGIPITGLDEKEKLVVTDVYLDNEWFKRT